MLKNNNKFRYGVIFLVFFMLTVPAGPGYSMSTIKSLVNKMRPGTFPEMEAPKTESSKPEQGTVESQEALTETERQILLSLTERKRLLDERELLLNQREEQLRALRDNIQRQIAELNRLQQKIEASMEAKKTQDAENLNKVVSLYNGMDPKKAAQKLQSLDTPVAVQILMAMTQRKASALLEELPPEQAKRVTEEIVRKVPAKKN